MREKKEGREGRREGEREEGEIETETEKIICYRHITVDSKSDQVGNQDKPSLITPEVKISRHASRPEVSIPHHSRSLQLSHFFRSVPEP